MSDEVLVKVEGVSKKFCRSLKRSLWYGVQDVSSELLGRRGRHDELRKNEFWAVNDVSFELRRGECLGLIGPNGAGKSTLLKMLNGLVKPDQGHITMRGRVGALIELGAGFNPILTARENIYVNGAVLGFSKKEIDRKFDAIVDFAEIEEFIDTPVQNYSSGMKVRLGFAVAAQMDPDVLMIDEVLAVGDTEFRLKCLNRMSRISKRSTIIFVSHSMPMISRMSSSVLMVDDGILKYLGNDVPVGISSYLERVRFGSERFERSDFFELISADICPSTSTESSHKGQVHFGHALDISLRFRPLKNTPDFIINISFMDVEGKQVAQCSSSNSGLVFDIESAEFAVALHLPQLLLNAGRYAVNVALVEVRSPEQRGEVLYLQHGIKVLDVVGGMGALAPVQFLGTWERVA
jgi:lipopolysaccharide transport system ATP-binding protein